MLIEAVRSVYAQTVQPLEILIVNDGNELETHDHWKNSPPIRVLENGQSRGANYSRNRGAMEAKGEILMFLDDDDTWECQKIERQMTIFHQQADVGLVYSGKLIVSSENRDIVLYKISAGPSGNLFPAMLERNLVGSTSSVAVRREVFLDAGKFDEALPALQDWDLWIRISKISMIDHDAHHSLRYTVAHSDSQISKNAAKRQTAICHLKRKFQDDITSLPFGSRRRVASNFHFLLAQVHQSRDLRLLLYFILRSELSMPNIRALMLLLPTGWLNFLRAKTSKTR